MCFLWIEMPNTMTKTHRKTTTKYLEVPQSIQKYLKVPRSTTKYLEVPQSTQNYPRARSASKYLDVAQSTLKYLWITYNDWQCLTMAGSEGLAGLVGLAGYVGLCIGIGKIAELAGRSLWIRKYTQVLPSTRLVNKFRCKMNLWHSLCSTDQEQDDWSLEIFMKVHCDDRRES